MGEIVVAGWFVSLILKELLDRTKSQVTGEFEKIDELQQALTNIEPITKEVERRLLNGDAEHAKYFNQIKEALYEAQDALGEHSYLSVQQERRNQLAQNANYPYLAFIRFFNLDKHHRKMTGVVNKLQKLSASDIKNTIDLSRGGSSHHVQEDNYFHSNRATTRDLKVEFLGRTACVAQLIADLTDPTCSHVVAIVGERGIGKTTLAQRVCGDPSVVRYFNDKIVWIWAAPKDKKLEITKEILTVMLNDRQLGDLNNFDLLHQTLKKELQTRRILLVLDDVGINCTNINGHEDLWDEVLDSFGKANSGSKVLVTTQWKKVANTMKGSKKILLEGLPEKTCQVLFETAAFGDRQDYPELRAKGEKIIAKLNGSPYLAKAVGKKLKGNTNRRCWDKILNKEKEMYEELVSDLQSRFKYLPEHLKRCFAYCSIFPINWRFERDSLVKMWISQDFIATKKKNLVDVGTKYFKELESWSFFQKINGTQYTIPHSMHYLAQSVSSYDCARIEGDKPEDVPKTVRHLSVTTNNLPELTKLGPQLKKLRTLLVITNPTTPSNSTPSSGTIEKKVFSKLKRLRLLDLSGCEMTELPQSILKFMHLRYLALCETLTSLPEPMGKLLLKVLVIPEKCILKELPPSIAQITTMEHFDMNRRYFAFISRIGEMTNIQSSVEFLVSGSKKSTNLRELKGLDNLLKELTIRNLENVTDKGGASQAELCKKEHLEVLQLEWNKATPNAVDVLDGLEPHKELKILHIMSYPGPSLPGWFKDPQRNLKYLYLTNCTCWEELPPLGHLPYLATLHVTQMPSVQQITQVFYGDVNEPFKHLKKLIFEQMPNWKSWAAPSTNENKYFSRLQKLKILNCRNLEIVPVVPETVTKLTIKLTKAVVELNLSLSPSINKEQTFNLVITSRKMLGGILLSRKHLHCTENLSIRYLKHATTEDFEIFVSLKTLQISESEITDEQLTNCLLHLNHLSKLKISSCGQLKSLSLPKEVTPKDLQLKDLTMLSSLVSLENNVSIRSLTIQNCPRVTVNSFPTNFKSLASLKNLCISNCRELKSLPASFPSTLEHFDLIECDPALNSSLKDKTGSEWEKIALIKDLVIVADKRAQSSTEDVGGASPEAEDSKHAPVINS